MLRAIAWRVAVLASLSSLGMLLCGCPGWNPSTQPGPAGEPRLVPFDSAGSLLTYFKQQASARLDLRATNWGAGAGGPTPTLAVSGNDQTAAAEGGASADGLEFSTTNVQEAGVDESDVFKSDGTYFYLAKGQSLRVLRASPPEQLAEVATLDLGIQIDSLYLHGATLIALGSNVQPYSSGGAEVMIWPPYYTGSDVVVSTVDIGDPEQPVPGPQMTLDGALVESRLVNDRLILVLTIVPNLPTNPTPLAVAQLSLEDVLPKVSVAGVAADMVSWDQWLRPAAPDGYYMTAVVTLDAADVTRVVHSVAVLASAGTIYASTVALYVTDTDYDPQDNYREQTAVHKFTFDADGAAQYTASGAVPGRLLNQFSLGEYNGYLRAATYVSNFVTFPIGMATSSSGVAVGGGGVSVAQERGVNVPYNGVYVLGEADAKLDVVGFVDGLAPNEQLYAARFLGERGFLVTFQKVDPLFVLDLADPQQPQVVGELTIPGFSDYLHPLDANHLIGVGNSVTPAAWGGVWWNRLQLSLFDVSNLASPTLVQQLELGGFRSYAEVKYTHKAFTLLEHDGRTLLALPSFLTPADSSPMVWEAPEFDGVLCFQVDPASGFTELGRVDTVHDEAFYWWPDWRRAAFIGDELYALSPAGVRAAALSDFATTYAVTLAPEPGSPETGASSSAQP